MFEAMLLTTDVNSGSVAFLIASSVLAGVASVWGAFRGDLKDCKQDREKLFVLFQEVQEENKTSAVRIGQLETTIARMESQLDRMNNDSA